VGKNVRPLLAGIHGAHVTMPYLGRARYSKSVMVFRPAS
jgi:hypothetical protein